jgi:hypothetical protein
LNIGNRVTIAYNNIVKCLLATRASNYKLILILILNSLLEEEYSTINYRDIRITSNSYKDISL